MRIIKGLAAGLLLILVVAGWSRISFNVDILKLLPAHLGQVQGLSLFLEHFSQPEELIITIEAQDPEQADTAAEELAARLRDHPGLVKRAVTKAPWEEDPASLSSLVAYLLLNRPPEELATLAARLSPEEAPERARESREILSESFSPQEIATATYDPLGLSRFLLDAGVVPGEQQSEFSSADGCFRVLYVTAAPPLENYKDAIAWIGQIRELAAAWNRNPAVSLGFTGEPAFVADISGTMEWDMMSSAFVTLFVIGLIFYICYRRFKPLLQLSLMLLIVFVITLGLAGFFMQELTVIGVGFASIMIGLSVDYGYLIYHRSVTHQGSLGSLQRLCLQNIMWTAGTTSAAFFALNLSSLPGLSQLGNLVGIGVLVGAGVMLTLFAPLAHAGREKALAPGGVQRLLDRPGFRRLGALISLLLVLGLGSAWIINGLPKVDSSVESLRPRHSGAHDAMDRLYLRLADDRDLLSLVVSGSSEEMVFERLQKTEERLQAAKERGEILSSQTALALWPAPAYQEANLPLLQNLAGAGPRLKQTLLDEGFTEEAFALTGSVLDQWKAWAEEEPPIWPHGQSADWILRRAAHRAEGNFLALGMVRPSPGREEALTSAIPTEGVYLVSWESLGNELHRAVPGEFLRLISGLLAIVIVLLLIGFRSVRDVLVLLVTLALAFSSLLGAMQLLGMQWNLFNLAAILLLLGTGIDYSILLLLALRKNGGRVAEAQRGLGVIIALCSISAVTGFGAIGWANHQGLASLGLTCALGLALDALISLFLLPVLWQLSRGRRPRFEN